MVPESARAEPPARWLTELVASTRSDAEGQIKKSNLFSQSVCTPQFFLVVITPATVTSKEKAAGVGSIIRFAHHNATMTTKVVVIFYSLYTHTWQLAQAIVAGAREVEGVEVELYQVPELLSDEVINKMGYAFFFFPKL